MNKSIIQKLFSIRHIRRLVLILFFFGSFFNFARIDLEIRKNALTTESGDKSVKYEKNLKTFYISKAEYQEIQTAKLIVNVSQLLLILELLFAFVGSYRENKISQ